MRIRTNIESSGTCSMPDFTTPEAVRAMNELVAGVREVEAMTPERVHAKIEQDKAAFEKVMRMTVKAQAR